MLNIPTFEEIRAAILRDLASLNPAADTAPDSDNYIRASSLASCATGQYAHQAWILRQFFPDTADTEFLERHCNLRGIRRKNATLAAGTAVVSGNAGAVVPAGVQIKCGGRFYLTRAEAVLDAQGQASIDVVASVAGAAFNQAEPISAQFMAAPAGIASEVLLQTAHGGTEPETDGALLARLLERLRRPPAGGNQYDYKAWALSVDGVTSAYVYPLRRGLGTVDVAITSGNDVPSDEIIQQTQDFIDSVRPVTAKNSFVIRPDVTKVNIEVRIKIAGDTLENITKNIQSALEAHFDAIKPTDPVIISQLEAAISDVNGVFDRVLVSPAGNLIADKTKKIEWFRLGTVKVGIL